MGNIEIERKFRVVNDNYKNAPRKVDISQGYICTGENSVRVRIYDSKAYLTIKDQTIGFARHEFEYAIPFEDARFMLDNICSATIEKTRYLYPFEGHTWEIDVFHGANEGLVIAEIELQKRDEQFAMPDFIGEEVTGDTRFYNAYLVNHPYKEQE